MHHHQDKDIKNPTNEIDHQAAYIAKHACMLCAVQYTVHVDLSNLISSQAGTYGHMCSVHIYTMHATFVL